MNGLHINVLGMDTVLAALMGSIDPAGMRVRAEGAMAAVIDDFADAVLESEDTPVGVYSHVLSAFENFKGTEWSGDVLTGYVDPSTVAPYVWPIIYGIAPGGKMPPPAMLQPWVEKKIGFMGAEARSMAFAIAKKQSTHGRAPNDFVTPIINANRDRWHNTIVEAVRGNA